jgi:hypothetical protein
MLGTELVGTEQEQHVEFAPGGSIDHAGDVATALARHEAEIERADARGGGVQYREAAPTFSNGADVSCQLGGQRQQRQTIMADETRPARR